MAVHALVGPMNTRAALMLKKATALLALKNTFLPPSLKHGDPKRRAAGV